MGRIVLLYGDPELPALAQVADPECKNESDETLVWHGARISEGVAKARRFSVELCAIYGFESLSSAVLALALLADPTFGAYKVFRRTSGLSHKEVLSEVQWELFGGELEGLAPLVSKYRHSGV